MRTVRVLDSQLAYTDTERDPGGVPVMFLQGRADPG
jgi:hypothetical protein